MTDVMMLLGPYPFMLNTAAYDGLKRTASYRWKKQARIGRKPANQYLGADLQTVQLSGTILPHFKGGLHQVDLMRTAASAAKPLLLVDGAALCMATG